MKTIKQKLIAKQIGVSESQMSRIISGLRTPSPVIADALSKMTSTDIRIWLFNTPGNLISRKKSLFKLKKEINEKKGEKNGSK